VNDGKIAHDGTLTSCAIRFLKIFTGQTPFCLEEARAIDHDRREGAQRKIVSRESPAESLDVGPSERRGFVILVEVEQIDKIRRSTRGGLSWHEHPLMVAPQSGSGRPSSSWMTTVVSFSASGRLAVRRVPHDTQRFRIKRRLRSDGGSTLDIRAHQKYESRIMDGRTHRPPRRTSNAGAWRTGLADKELIERSAGVTAFEVVRANFAERASGGRSTRTARLLHKVRAAAQRRRENSEPRCALHIPSRLASIARARNWMGNSRKLTS